MNNVFHDIHIKTRASTLVVNLKCYYRKEINKSHRFLQLFGKIMENKKGFSFEKYKLSIKTILRDFSYHYSVNIIFASSELPALRGTNLKSL